MLVTLCAASKPEWFVCCYRSLWSVHTQKAVCSSGLQDDIVDLEKSNWKQ